MKILQMFADFISCFIDSSGVEVLITEEEAKKYEKFNYYNPSIFTINIKMKLIKIRSSKI